MTPHITRGHLMHSPPKFKRLYAALLVAGIALPTGYLNAATEIVLNDGQRLDSLELHRTNLTVRGRAQIDNLRWIVGAQEGSRINLINQSELVTTNRVNTTLNTSKYGDEPLTFNISGPNARWTSYGGFSLGATALNLSNGAVFQDFGTGTANAIYATQWSDDSVIALSNAMWVSQRGLNLNGNSFGIGAALTMSNSRMQVGSLSTSRYAYIDISNNSRVDITGNLNLGRAGELYIGESDLWISGDLNTNANSYISMNQGHLSLLQHTGAPANFNWEAGEVTLRGENTVRLGEGLLNSSLTLDAGKRLNIYSKLEIGSGTSLRVTDGILSVPTVKLNGGSLSLTDWNAGPIAFDWSSGTLELVGVSREHTQAILNKTPVLDAGKTLITDRPIVLDRYQILGVAGGTLKIPQLQLNSSEVSLTSGQITTNQIDINNYSHLVLDGGQLNASNVYLNSGDLYIRNDAQLNGKLTFNSGNLYISSKNDVQLGSAYLPSVLSITTGSTMRVDNTLIVGAGSSLNIAGGVLLAGKLSLQGGSIVMSELDYGRTNLNWERGTVRMDGLVAYDNKLAREVPVLDAGKSLSLSGMLRIGPNTALTIDGGELSALQVVLDGGSLSLLDYTKFGSRLNFQSGTLNLPQKVDISLGSAKLDSTMSLSKGQTLNLGAALNINTGSQLTLAGGTLRTNAINLNGGKLAIVQNTSVPKINWNSGTLSYAGDATVGAGALGQRTFILNNAQNLEVGQTLTIGKANNMILDGGMLKVGTLALQGGRVNGALDMTTVGSLQGYGTVSGAISGGKASRIVASGGMLTLGDGNDTAGYQFAGTLDVGSNQVWLQNLGTITLGHTTLLGNKGQLHSSDGMELLLGSTLISQGDASIYGKFINYGSVVSNNGTLSFFDDVSGQGNFSGQTLFRSGYTPGGQGIGASINFGGGSASYDHLAMLSMDILDGTSDYLGGISQLNFNGTLRLLFTDSFKALPGTSIKLFGFQNFSGQFDESNILVEGIDRRLIDFSHLSKDGAISVSAVPEPSNFAMFATGVGLLAWRRRSKQHRAEGTS